MALIEFKVNKTVRVEKVKAGKMILLVLTPQNKKPNAPGVLWIHGGGYSLGMKEMVLFSRAVRLAEKYGAVVVAPRYRSSLESPYPAAIDDCYEALLYMKNNARALGINRSQIMVGGESAGGGLCAALCMLARDLGEVNVAYQMPLYPMLDNRDTVSSRDNHGKVWNTRRNHTAWKLYLRGNKNDCVMPYASPARQGNYSGLPPAYTFVGSGEPFYQETMDYVRHLKQAGVEAEMDVYDTDLHSFDIFRPKDPMSIEARDKFEKHFEYAIEHYFANND